MELMQNLTQVNRSKRKRKHMFFLLFLLFGTIGVSGTLAYFAADHNVLNQLSSEKSGVYLQEVFNSSDQWLPGETKEKSVYFGNQGKKAQVIRFKVETEWKDKGMAQWVPLSTAPADINYQTAFLNTKWTKIGDWFYYNHPLDPGGETNPIMDSVKFSDELTNTAGGQEDFSGATYRVMVKMESLNVTKAIVNSSWEVDFTGTDTLTWIPL